MFAEAINLNSCPRQTPRRLNKFLIIRSNLTKHIYGKRRRTQKGEKEAQKGEIILESKEKTEALLQGKQG